MSDFNFIFLFFLFFPSTHDDDVYSVAWWCVWKILKGFFFGRHFSNYNSNSRSTFFLNNHSSMSLCTFWEEIIYDHVTTALFSMWPCFRKAAKLFFEWGSVTIQVINQSNQLQKDGQETQNTSFFLDSFNTEFQRLNIKTLFCDASNNNIFFISWSFFLFIEFIDRWDVKSVEIFFCVFSSSLSLSLFYYYICIKF